ncbi:cytosolic carboxypeptidase 2-like isoform X2 [Heterodontus francisci]|uniref:cytosolic carboxypeptidase 2-like isoform X2 n=1 Tax=Heterodontus francisci TaxID=7792 RepID=UPI00355B4444
MNTQRLSRRVLLNDNRSSPDELSVSKDVLGLRPRNRKLTSHSHLCLMLTSCSCPVEKEEFARPWIIPRVEDGLSEGEDEEPKRKSNIKDMAFWKKSVSVGKYISHDRTRIISQRRNPQIESTLTQKTGLYSQIKKNVAMSKTDQTCQESLKKQSEAELGCRVVEALETSTSDRTRRYNVNFEEQKNGQCGITEDLIQALPLSFLSGTESPIRTVRHLSLPDCHRIWGSDTKNALKRCYKIKGLEASMKEIFHSRLQQSEFPAGVYTLENNIQLGLGSKDPTIKGLMRDGGSPFLDQKQLKKFKKYSKEGILEIISRERNSKSREGSNKTNGVPLNRHGPFWPVGFGPLCSTPSHIINCPENEALWHKIEQASDNTAVELSNSQLPNNPSRCKHLVFDSRTHSKGSIPHSIPEDWAPSLIFESRFESGNLHQAWRIGQYEYDLMLAVDMFTSRHTQWYYFRIQNTVTNVTYKFKIVNLLKKDSLYNYGMKPLVYSEKDAKEQNIGWFRSGHHIMYKPWNKKTFNNLFPYAQHYCLEFQIEFSNKDDTYYLAHCYPYRYTDLKAHLDEIINDSKHLTHFKKEVLCETRAGNSCFLLTITDYTGKENSEAKLGVVLTARVHPGETQSSWMMKGILDFLISEEPTAKELRRRCIFKIIPMLNPDGVIVGNYRCSLSARDLNRNYRHPKQELFPTVWHTKKMVEELQKDHYIILYVDLHGHSRKPNAFMYGCSQTGTTYPFGILNYLRERIFPWLISQKDPERFDWKSCKFHIHKCKESTGRVVMYRQLGLSNSFTLEASFSGAVKEQLAIRHFNIKDYMSIGKTFCEGIMDYIRLDENPLKLNEVISNLSYSITMNQRGNSTPTVASDLTLFAGEDKRQKYEEITADDDSESNLIQFDAVKGSFKLNSYNAEHELKKQPKHQQAKNFLQLEDKMSLESLQQCYALLNQMNLSEAVLESETSEDSNSDFESEVTFYSKTRKKKIQRPSKVRTTLPALSIRQMGKHRNKQRVKEVENAEKLQEQSNSHLLKKNEGFSHIPVRNQIFFFCTDHQSNEGLNRCATGSKREPIFSQCESNYRNIETTSALEGARVVSLTQDKRNSKFNSPLASNESPQKLGLWCQASPFSQRQRTKAPVSTLVDIYEEEQTHNISTVD